MPATLTRIDDKFLYSISQLATAFKMSRDTVRKRLVNAGVESSDVRGNHAVYHIGQAAEAICSAAQPSLPTDYDPETLPPKERLDWFKSETEKDRLALSRGDLVTADDNRRAIIDVVKVFLQPLETIGDTMEREGVLGVDELERFEVIIDDIRNDLADTLERYELRQP